MLLSDLGITGGIAISAGSAGALSPVGVGVAAAAVAAGTAISVSGVADITAGISMIVSKSTGGSDGEPEITKEMNSQSKNIAKGNEIRDVNRLVKEYGGEAKNWIKKKGWDAQGTEWHWYEHKGIGKFEFKIKY